MMKKIFISHPLSDNPELRKLQVDDICKHYTEQGYLPLSPLHAFSYIDEETPSLRENIMQVCFDMIDYADEILFIQYGYGLSKGQAREYLYCMEQGYEMEFMSGDEFEI